MFPRIRTLRFVLAAMGKDQWRRRSLSSWMGDTSIPTTTGSVCSSSTTNSSSSTTNSIATHNSQTTRQHQHQRRRTNVWVTTRLRRLPPPHKASSKRRTKSPQTRVVTTRHGLRPAFYGLEMIQFTLLLLFAWSCRLLW